MLKHDSNPRIFKISDGVLDAIFDKDPNARVACETFVTTGLVVVGGEVTTKAYVDEIKDKSLKRNLLTLTTEIKRVTVEEELPSAEVVDIVEKKLYEITQDNHTTEYKDSPKITFDTTQYIKEMKARGNSVLVGVDTGFHELNKMTTGFGKGDLVIIAARPAMGKTSFILLFQWLLQAF